MWSQRAEKSETSAKPLKVLVVAPSLEMLGGQSRQCARLLKRLYEEPSLKVSFVPVNPRLPGVLGKLQQIKYVRTVLTTLFYWMKLLAHMGQCEVLHVFSASYYSYMLSAAPAILFGKLFGKKVILNYHSGEAEDHLQNWRLTAIPTIRLADEVVVPSGYLVDVFARFNLRARAIFNILDLDHFHFRERTNLRPVFLSSRLLEPLYNVGCVIRAFAIIQKHYPEASLTVAGEGWMRAELEDLARELKLQNTRFLGRVPYEEMPAMYDAADIYLSATNLDNMPLSLMECMACGLPVVTTDAGGVPYIMTNEETCLMVERNNPEAMAQAAMRLLNDSQLAQSISRKGHEASSQFGWSKVQDEWLKLYHQVAQGSAGEN